LSYAVAITMARNVEIKAVLRDRKSAELVAGKLSGTSPAIIHQEDTFFRCDNARLKLRIFDASHGELIRYKRPDLQGVRISQYTIARTQDPGALLSILTETLGQTGSVKKRRTLYLIGQTRVHLDEVEGLGDFLELEVVLRAEQSAAEGEAIAHELLAQFAIAPTDLIAKPYVELLQNSQIAASTRGHYNSARSDVD
jgi:predicted adenylyl cyclase CyaB